MNSEILLPLSPELSLLCSSVRILCTTKAFCSFLLPSVIVMFNSDFFFKGCYFTPLSSLLKKPFQWFCPHFPLQQIIFTTTQRVIHLSLFQLSLLLQAILYRDIWERYQIAYSDILNDLQNMYTMYFFAVIVFFVLSFSNLTIMLIIFSDYVLIMATESSHGLKALMRKKSWASYVHERNTIWACSLVSNFSDIHTLQRTGSCSMIMSWSIPMTPQFLFHSKFHAVISHKHSLFCQFKMFLPCYDGG